MRIFPLSRRRAGSSKAATRTTAASAANKRRNMSHEIERVLFQAEDFLRRNLLRPSSAREAQKRRARRKFEEFLRRLRRAGFLLAGLLFALVLASVLTEVGFLTWLVALPTIFLIAFLSLFWSTG